jgi:Sap, sulfolipid-1-addressing protein
MFLQATGFAFLAALSPGALVVVTAYLGSERPRQAVTFFLIGALLMTIVAAIVIVVALHAGGLSHPRQRQPRYGLRLGLGVIALGASVFVHRRKPKPPDPNKKKGLVSRLLTRPGPMTALAAGIIVFIPSAAFIAAAQVIATARSSVDTVAGALALVVLIDVLFAWLPLVLYLLAPDATAVRLKALSGWLHEHGHKVLVGVLGLAGFLLVADGIYGLAA